MFAYCRNNPVHRIDVTGTLDYECDDEEDELASGERNDWTNAGDAWSALTQTMHYAAKGLDMARGYRSSGPYEYHHIFSNKNKTYTPQYEAIVRRYDMSLDDTENIVYLQGHHGRHTIKYHELMLVTLQELDTIANGDISKFQEGFMLIVAFVKEFPWLPYAR